MDDRPPQPGWPSAPGSPYASPAIPPQPPEASWPQQPTAAWPPQPPTAAPPPQQAWLVPPPAWQPPGATASSSSPAAARRRARWLPAGLLGIVGGYVIVLALSGPLLLALTNFSGVYLAPALMGAAQLLFGVVAVLAAYLLAPGPIGLRLTAVVLLLGVVGLAVGVVVARTTLVLGGPLSAVVFSQAGILVVGGGLCWLLACRARILAYLSLLPALALFLPIAQWLLMAGADNALVTFVTHVLALVAALVILGASAARKATDP